MEPIPETGRVLSRLSSTTDGDLVAELAEEAQSVLLAVPGCVGISVTLRCQELTFTWLSTDGEVRLIDAAQYVDGGPCEQAVEEQLTYDVSDVLDEDRWQMFGLASAALGVRNSLSLPLRDDRGAIGSVNFYGRDADTFQGRERHIAQMFGADVQSVVMNADLSMSSRLRAERAVETLDSIDRVSVASGVLARRRGITVEEAAARLHEAAERADAPVAIIAEIVVHLGSAGGYEGSW